MINICLALIGVAFAINLPLTAVLLRCSRRYGLMDNVGAESHKQHAVAMPNTGGVGLFWSVALPMILCMIAVWVVPEDWFYEHLPVVAQHLRGLRETTSMGGGVLCALAVLHLMGLYDDRYPLGPYLKLAVQGGVALGLVLFCQMRVLEFLTAAHPLGHAASVAVSVAWIVTIVNAFNMLDNMDGLSAGVAMVCSAIYLAATLIGGQWFVASLAALLLGALLAFLLFNFPPAKMFMGDGGSLVIGLLLAVISIRTTYFHTDVSVVRGHWHGLLMPLVVMAVPLYDFMSVTVIRLVQGRSPFAGDHQHFSHRLVRMGLSKVHAVLLIWLCALATGLGGVMLGALTQWQAVLVGGQTLAVLLLLAMLEYGQRR